MRSNCIKRELSIVHKLRVDAGRYAAFNEDKDGFILNIHVRPTYLYDTLSTQNMVCYIM